ncbi:MAG: hypothetical protein QG622_2342 [Actinomycetota bacterium]|nr:hypothetical protein [Actinomycetota bacterium]
MNGVFIDHPAPASPLCGFSVDVIPSTSADEYRNANSGSSPAGAGTTGTPILVENVPVCSPTSHAIDAFKSVALYDPALDDGELSNATTATADDDTPATGLPPATDTPAPRPTPTPPTPPTPPADTGETADTDEPATDGETDVAGDDGETMDGVAGVTTPVTFRDDGSFTDTTGVPTRHPSTCGDDTAHAGKDTNRNRPPKSPPNASATDE